MKSLSQYMTLVLLYFIFLIFYVDCSSNHSVNGTMFDNYVIEEQIKEVTMLMEDVSNQTKHGLGNLFDKIDTNDDFFVVEKELMEWIVLYNEELQLNQSKAQIKHLDRDKDSAVSWEEYRIEHYSTLSMEDIEDEKVVKDIKKFYNDDKFRFDIADFDKNGKLTVKELKAFLHPHNHIEMLDYEVRRALNEYDKNNDKMIDKEEFMETQYGSTRLTITQRTYVNKVFGNFDSDDDKQLNESEIKAWLKPDILQFAKTESQYLMKVSDTDKDQKLSKREVLDSLIHWTNSKATNYGHSLRDEL